MTDLPKPIIEAASWALAAEMMRRHPRLTLIRTHPVGGGYDCLSLRGPGVLEGQDGLSIDLNRAHGRIHTKANHDGSKGTDEPREWDAYLQDPDDFTNRLEEAAGLPSAEAHPLSPTVAVYKTIAALTAVGAFTEGFDVSEGFVDSTGQSDSFEADWWPTMRALDPDGLTEPISGSKPDPYCRAGYRFWRVRRHDFDLVFETSTASMWASIDDIHLGEVIEADGSDRDEILAEHWENLIEAAGVGASPEQQPRVPDSESDLDRTPVVRLLTTALEYGRVR